MATYKGEKFIRQQLDSIFSQTFENWQLVISDDGSTDNSVSVLVDNIADERLIVVNKLNGGESSARNFGIKLSKYDYVAFIDADDIWHPEYLEKIRELIFKFPRCGLYCTNYDIIKINGDRVKAHRSSALRADTIIRDYFKISRRLPLVTSNTAVIPVHVFDSIGYFNETIKMGPDLEMWYRVIQNYQIAFSSYTGATYFHDADNRVCNNALYFSESFFVSLAKIFETGKFRIQRVELLYLNDLVCKELVRLKITLSGSDVRRAIDFVRNLNLPLINWRIYFLLSFLPSLCIRVFYRIEYILLK